MELLNEKWEQQLFGLTNYLNECENAEGLSSRSDERLSELTLSGKIDRIRSPTRFQRI